jgi:hypothetical protein
LCSLVHQPRDSEEGAKFFINCPPSRQNRVRPAEMCVMETIAFWPLRGDECICQSWKTQFASPKRARGQRRKTLAFARLPLQRSASCCLNSISSQIHRDATRSSAIVESVTNIGLTYKTEIPTSFGPLYLVKNVIITVTQMYIFLFICKIDL